jgi:hypothetical protein
MNTTDVNRRPAFRLDDADPVVVECARAWNEAKTGTNLSKGADSYYAGPPPKWAKFAVPTVTIGRHNFMIARDPRSK